MGVRGLLNYLVNAKKDQARSPATNRIDLVDEASKLERGLLILFDLRAVLPYFHEGSDNALYGGDLQITLQRLTMFLTVLEQAKIRTSWYVEVPGAGILDSFPYRHEEMLKEEKLLHETITTHHKYAQGKVSNPPEHLISSPLLIPILLSTLKTLGVTVHTCVAEQQPPLGPWEAEPAYVVTDNVDFAVTKSCFMIPTVFFDIEKVVRWGTNPAVPVMLIAEYTSPEILAKHFRLGHPPREEWGKPASEQPQLQRKWWVEKCLTELCLLIGTESTGPVLEKQKLWKKCGISDGKNIDAIARWFRDQVYSKKLLWRDVKFEHLHDCLTDSELQFPAEYSRAVYGGLTRNLMRLYANMTEWKLQRQELGIDVFLRPPKSMNTYGLVCEESIMGLYGYVELTQLLEDDHDPVCHRLTLPLRESLYLLTGVSKVEERERGKDKSDVNLEREPSMNFYNVLRFWNPEQKANFVLALCSARIEKFNGIDVPTYFRQILATHGEVEPSALNLAYVAAAYMATLNVDIDGATGNIREHEFDTIILSLLLTFQAQTQPHYASRKESLMNAWELRKNMSISYRFSSRGLTFMTWWQQVLRLCLGIYESLELGITASSLLNIFNPAVFVSLYSAGAWEEWELPVPSDSRNQAFFELNQWAEHVLQVRWELVQNSEFQVVKQQILSWLAARDYTPKFTKPETAAPLGSGITGDTLPIDAHRDRITEHIFNHRITCIQGETGCGKSTRVPVYILEHWKEGGQLPPKVLAKQLEYEKEEADRPATEENPLAIPRGTAMEDKVEEIQYFRKPRIMVTQPRRIACISLAKRVADQLGEKTVGRSVGYQISGDSTASRHTEIVYVTTGYLLQVLVNDPSRLKEYTHLILDEVHERDVDSDLVNLVVKLQLLNFPFHLVIMSATLQGDLFGRYFCEGHHRVKPIYVGAKRYPVEIVHLEDIVSRFGRGNSYDDRNGFSEQVVRTIQKAGRTFGAGYQQGWQDEAEEETRNEFASSGESDTESDVEPMMDVNVQLRKRKEKLRSKVPSMMQPGFDLLVKEVIQKCCTPGESILVFFPGIGEITEIHEILLPLEEESQNTEGATKVCVYVLHSLIPKDEQELAVFSDPPPDTCHVILASNIAESSLTLPRVRVVIDFGLRRQLVYDSRRHMSCLVTCWVSQASAKQRMGRTGRVFEGVVVRLFSKYFYDNAMDEFDPPEMQTAPLEKLYVNVKVLSAKLPAFTAPGEKVERKLEPRELLCLTAQPPDTGDLNRAVGTLEEMGALSSSKEDADLTLLGHLMLALPIDIYLCRMIIYGALFGCAADAVVFAAVLSAQDPFTLPSHLVIKKPEEYAEALYRSYKSRSHFDASLLSEPIMLRNMFVTWLTKFNDQKKPSRKQGWHGRETPRASYLRFSQQFARETGAAIVPKRCVHLCTSVLDTATRFRKFLVDDSKAARDIDCLLDMLSQRFYVSQQKNTEPLFLDDSNVLRLLMTGSFAPNFMVGGTKIRGPKSPQAFDPNARKGVKKQQKVEANKMEALFEELVKYDMDPLNSVCVPLEVPRWIRRSTERLSKDLQATLEMMLSIGENSQNPKQYVHLKLEKDWKKMYVEVKTKDSTEEELEIERELKEREDKRKKELEEKRLVEKQERRWKRIADREAKQAALAKRQEEAAVKKAKLIAEGKDPVEAEAETAVKEEILCDDNIESENENNAEDPDVEKGTPTCPKGKISIESVTSSLHLFDQFGAGRFKFLVNLVDTEWKEKQEELLQAEMERREQERLEREQQRRENELKKWFNALEGDKYYRVCDALRVDIPINAENAEADIGIVESVMAHLTDVAKATRCREIWVPKDLPLLHELLRERMNSACKRWVTALQGHKYERFVNALRETNDSEAAIKVEELAKEWKYREAIGRKELPLLRSLVHQRLEGDCKTWFSSLQGHTYRRVSFVLKADESYHEDIEVDTTEEVTTEEEREEREEVESTEEIEEEVELEEGEEEAPPQEGGEEHVGDAGVTAHATTNEKNTEKKHGEGKEEGAKRRTKLVKRIAPKTRVVISKRMVPTTKVIASKRSVRASRDEIITRLLQQTRAPRTVHLEDLPLLREIHLNRWLETLEFDTVKQIRDACRLDDEAALEALRQWYPTLGKVQLARLREMEAKKAAQGATISSSSYPSGTPCPSGSPFPQASPMPSTPNTTTPRFLTPRGAGESGDNPDGEEYGGDGAEQDEKAESEHGEQLQVTMYRPVSPCEVSWDVYTPTPDSEIKEAVAVKANGKKKKKSGPKVSKGRCCWRNIMGYLCSTKGAQSNHQYGMLPSAPVPNEICAVFTSQQGSEQGGGVIWLDGVSVIPDPKAFVAFLLTFTPHMYTIDVHARADTGVLTQVTIGDAPLDPRGLKLDDLQRISALRVAISDAYLGTRQRKNSEVTPPIEKRDNSKKVTTSTVATAGAAVSGAVGTGAGAMTATTSAMTNGPDPSLQITPRTLAAMNQEHTHRVDIELDAEPELGDAPEVRAALQAMLDNLGVGTIPFAYVKDKDGIIQRNVQQQEMGRSFRILRPLHDLMVERKQREEDYMEMRRKLEEERRRKEEEKRRREEAKRRLEEEKRRKREEDKRYKQEEHRRRQEAEKMRKQADREQRRKLHEDQQQALMRSKHERAGLRDGQQKKLTPAQKKQNAIAGKKDLANLTQGQQDLWGPASSANEWNVSAINAPWGRKGAQSPNWNEDWQGRAGTSKTKGGKQLSHKQGKGGKGQQSKDAARFDSPQKQYGAQKIKSDARVSPGRHAPTEIEPLPKGWNEVWNDEQKKFYYWDTTTNKTQWERPSTTLGQPPAMTLAQQMPSQPQPSTDSWTYPARQQEQQHKKSPPGHQQQQQQQQRQQQQQQQAANEARQQQAEMQRLAHIQQQQQAIATRSSQQSGELSTGSGQAYYPVATNYDEQQQQQIAWMQQMQHWQQQQYNAQGQYGQFLDPTGGGW